MVDGIAAAAAGPYHLDSGTWFVFKQIGHGSPPRESSANCCAGFSELPKQGNYIEPFDALVVPERAILPFSQGAQESSQQSGVGDPV
jgi:hypothetical protein